MKIIVIGDINNALRHRFHQLHTMVIKANPSMLINKAIDNLKQVQSYNNLIIPPDKNKCHSSSNSSAHVKKFVNLSGRQFRLFGNFKPIRPFAGIPGSATKKYYYNNLSA